ncbi:hypothetical protein SHKM778_56370 [Streptomyces sp. KM77-8]|uniref:Phytanoyl-CoA dioxygenase n=1 Tax=Streptomyces haneummycinicus TaxID=3074435 RepID=A0AAT9HPY5_9ACTN
MSASIHQRTPAPAAWLSERHCDLGAFRALVERSTDLDAYPHASAVERNVLLYDADRLALADRPAVQAELVRAFADGPGIVVVRGAFADPAVVDRTTAVFEALITEQRATGAAAGDHFAKPGANDRVWNALEKAALYDPEAFAEYYANEVIALVSSAWLGPGYQVTSQVNVVNPGGAAQTAHRDYHLGFLSDEAAARYPAHVHRLSPCSRSRARWRTATCPWSPGPRCICRTRRSTSPAISPGGARTSARTSRSTMYSSRSPRATRCSSIRRCSTPPAPTTRRTSGGWPTCSRCRRRSAGRWRRWTARPWRAPSTRCC